MLKRVAIALLCLPLLGFGIIPISGRRDAAPGGGIEDDFSGDLSKWTQLTTSGSNWTITADVLDDEETSGVIIYTDEQTSTISQWVMWEYVDGNYKGAYFRSTNNSGELAYALRRHSNANADLVWRHCTGHSCSDIDTWDTTINPGDCIGMEITGTGSGQELDVWDLGSGGCPVARGSWGSADDTLVNTSGNYADTGKYVGLYSGSGSGTGKFDNFSAGDI